MSIRGITKNGKNETSNVKTLQRKRRDSVAPKQQSVVRANLPKEIIIKYHRTHLDWYRFCNRFLEIGSNFTISNVTNFSYL